LTLFAALNYLEGKLITRLAARPRPSPGQACHQEWLAFLKTIDEETPGDLAIHIIADNYATHKHPAVTRWLDRHARFHMHYTPTSSSWMNLVERFFRDLTEFLPRRALPRPENWPTPSSRSSPRATTILGATFGKPRAKRSCAR